MSFGTFKTLVNLGKNVSYDFILPEFKVLTEVKFKTEVKFFLK